MNTDIAIWIAAVAVAGYLLGSIPFGVLLTRAAGLGDVRAIGSGNIGATNVLRTGRKDLALLTLLLDGGKGAAAVLLGAASLPWAEALLETRIDPEWRIWAGAAAGAAAFLGHLFPVWLGFKGGKGVATFIGCLIGLKPLAALVFAGVWLATAAATRYSSLAALVASLATPVALWVMGERQMAELFILLAVLLWWKHGQNITRLLAGTEGRIGQKG